MNYWAKRILQDEEKAQLIAEQYANMEKAYYKRIVNTINSDINALYTNVQAGQPITRSELWQYESYKRLRTTILNECKQLGLDQVSLTEQALDKVVETVLGTSWKQNDATGAYLRTQTKKYLNQAWSGQNYSSRIYHNCNELSSILQSKISDMVCLGKNPDVIKAEIMRECGVSYNAANRLVRTEASYTFNQANKDRYVEMGAKAIEVLVEDDACDACKELEHQQFEFHNAPIIPLHPNCRCCYLPVV